MSYNKLSEMCFLDCVHDFTTRKVLESEVCHVSVIGKVGLAGRVDKWLIQM